MPHDEVLPTGASGGLCEACMWIVMVMYCSYIIVLLQETPIPCFSCLVNYHVIEFSVVIPIIHTETS